MVHTLELFQHPATANAWHSVTAPGGYEWWYFDAEDVEHDRQIVAMLFDGFVFHPGYLRKYFRYARNPTHVAPPLPSDYICVYFVVYHAGKIEHQFMTQYPAEQFEARRDSQHVQIGPNRFSTSNGALNLWLGGTPRKRTVQASKLLSNTQIMGSFSFKPRLPHAPDEREFFSRQLDGADHRWVIADSSCDCEGEIRVATSDGTEVVIPFRGRGYHDHNFGIAPIAPGIKQWFSGRMLLDDRTVTFHYARTDDWKLEHEMQLIEIDSTGAHEIDADKIEIDWSRRTAARLRYPARANFQDVLQLTNPRVIDSAPFYLRVMYDGALRGQRGTVFCHVTYPHRLRWPVLGRMIEMSIDTRAMNRGK